MSQPQLQELVLASGSSERPAGQGATIPCFFSHQLRAEHDLTSGLDRTVPTDNTEDEVAQASASSYLSSPQFLQVLSLAPM